MVRRRLPGSSSADSAKLLVLELLRLSLKYKVPHSPSYHTRLVTTDSQALRCHLLATKISQERKDLDTSYQSITSPLPSSLP